MSQRARIASRLIQCFIVALLLCAHGAGQQTPATGNSPADGIAKAREVLKAAEAAHPGDTAEVAEALNDLISQQIDAGIADADTLALVDRIVKIAVATAGARSKTYVNALVIRMDVLIGLNRAPEARVVAEEAFEIAQREFPGSSEAGAAAGALVIME
jgi:hypothetical protein